MTLVREVPFNDLNQHYRFIKDEIDEAISLCLHQSQFIGGTQVTEFENRFAKYMKIDHCIGCANGTDALEILLRSINVGNDDEVIVPATTWISTSEAVSIVGAKPVFADIDPDYYTISPEDIENRITEKTKAIIPVHLYGQPCDMISLCEIARKYNLYLIEDCAQAHGAKISHRAVGTWGDCASFSFYPGKNLGAFGDAGCMITNRKEIAQKAKLISNHGQIQKHNHLIEGKNSRLDTLQAAVLNVKLNYLENWNKKRKECATLYANNLKDVHEVVCPKMRKNTEHVFHLFVIRVKDRDALREYLESRGVATSIHYPRPLPDLPCYSYLDIKDDDYHVARAFHKEILSLPIFPEMTEDQIGYVTDCINEFYI